MIVNMAWPSSHHRTGGVVALYQFANGLARRGHEVHFVHGPAWPDRIDTIDELGWFGFEESVRHHIVDSLDDPTLVPGDISFVAGHDRLGLPVTTVQGFRMLSYDIERENFRLPLPKVCIAKWLLGIGRSFGVPDEQLWYVPLGIDHDLFVPRTEHRDRRYDVAVFHNEHPSKGWARAWQALGRARDRVPDLRAVVFGANLPRQPLPDWVTFLHYPHHDELASEVYDQTRILLMPSRHEGFGFTAVEAMACGAALITTDNGGSRDYAIPGETALVVGRDSTPEMTDAIVGLLADDALRQRLAAAGERYVRRFDWDEGAAILEGHLVRYLANPGAFRAEPADDSLTRPRR